MSKPTETKEFVLDEQGVCAFGRSEDRPDHFAFIAQDSEGRRRVIYIPDDMFVGARLGQQICKLSGVRKLHHKVRSDEWHYEFGPGK